MELYKAVLEGNLDKVLQKDLDINTADEDGDTALHVAVSSNKPDAVRKLLDAGISVDAVNESGETALHIAVKEKNLEIAEILLDHGADMYIEEFVQGGEYNEGYNALHLAVLEVCSSIDKSSCMVKLLIDHGIDVNINDDNGCTALHLAVERDMLDIASLLLDNGADTDETCYHGRETLELAESVDMVRLLLDNDAYVSPRMILQCIENHNTDLLEVYLDYPHVNEDLDGHEYLHKAIKYENTEALELLIHHGADVNETNDSGRTPLQYAVKMGNKSAAHILADEGCKGESD